MSRSRSLNKLFADASGDKVAEVIAKTARLKTLEQLLLAHLPESLRAHTELAEISDKTLTLIGATSVVASRLRFMETELLANINRDDRLPTLEKVRTIVRSQSKQIETTSATRNTRTGETISAATAQLIEQTSETIENPRLARALKQLARHGSQHDPEKSDQAVE